MKLILNIALLCSLIVMNTRGICQTINEGTNPTATRARCTYTFVGGTGNTFNCWILPTSNNAIPVRDDSNAPQYNLLRTTLPVIWKNVEASAYPDSSILQVQYTDNLGILRTVSKSCGPFSLTFKTVTFAGGSSKNIPCYSTAPVTIALNNYVNTENNGYDQGKWITRHFEWTLPSGWQTTSFQSGTFVGPSSITVIPPASAATATISVKAKANTQKSAAATLQITRNLEPFSITGPTSVVYNTTYRYTVPSYPGISYSWQLPNGWSGSSNTNYIDVTVGCGSGNIIATMTGCNGSKSSTIAVSQSIVPPGTAISGTSYVCPSGEQFSVNNIPPGVTVNWTGSGGLSCDNPSGNPTTFRATANGGGAIQAVLISSCGNITLPVKYVETSATAAQAPTSILGFEFDGQEFPSKSMSLFSVDPCEGATNYVWSVTGGTIDSGQGTESINVRTNYVASGNIDFSVSVSAGNDCFGQGASFMRQGLVFADDILNISPNPTNSVATIELTQGGEQIAQGQTDWTLEIYEGTQLLKLRTSNIRGNKQGVNTSDWKDGIYIVRATIGDKVITKKMIVKH